MKDSPYTSTKLLHKNKFPLMKDFFEVLYRNAKIYVQKLL